MFLLGGALLLKCNNQIFWSSLGRCITRQTGKNGLTTKNFPQKFNYNQVQRKAIKSIFPIVHSDYRNTWCTQASRDLVTAGLNCFSQTVGWFDLSNKAPMSTSPPEHCRNLSKTTFWWIFCFNNLCMYLYFSKKNWHISNTLPWKSKAP